MKKCLPNLKFLTIAFAMLLMASVAGAQTLNDYQSTGGNWATLASWQRWNGGAWATPSVGEGYPGQFNSPGLVTILDNDAITLNVTPLNSIGALTIAGGANASTLTISAGFALNVTGVITYGAPTDNSSDKTITLAAVNSTLTCGSITMPDLVTANDNDILNVNAGTVTVSGNLTMNANAAGENSVAVTTGALSIGGVFSTTGDFTAGAGSTIDYNGAAQTVRGATYSNLVLSGSGAKTTSSVTVTDKLTVSGTATVGNAITYSSAILEYGGGSAQTTSVNEFAASTTNITAVVINKSAGTVTLDAAKVLNGNLTLTSGTLGAGTNLSIGATGTPLITVDGGTLTGTLQGVNDYDIDYTGVSKTASGELTGSGIRNIDVDLNTATDIVTLSQNIAPDGDVTLGTGILNLSTFTINRSAAGGTFNITNSSTLRIGGTNSLPSNYTHNISAGGSATVDYAGTAQSVIDPIGGDNYAVLILSGSGVKTLAATSVDVLLSIQGTATIAGASPTYAAAAILEYKGSAAQTISNVEFVGTGANPTNLTIDNAAGVTLPTAKTINGALALVHGYLTTTGVLTIGNAGTASTTNGAFVNGQLNKAKNTTTRFDFPVGNLTGGLRIVGVTPQTTAGTTYGASFLSASPKTSIANGNNLGGIQQISACEYWNVAQVTGTTPARITLSWPASTASCGSSAWGPYITQPSTLLVAHHNGANWTNEGNSGTTVVTPGTALDGGTVTSNNYLGTFSPFTIGTTNGAFNPLPVLFGDVKAFEKGAGVQIEWTNLTEKDVVSYSVERSVNGRDFISISRLSARSNVSDAQSYLSFDGAPGATNFYRIKVVEADGHIVYSKLMKVDIGKSPKGLVLYPNPVVGNDLSIGFTAARGQYNLSVVNAAGQQIYSQKINHAGGTVSQAITLPSAVKAGIYNMMISGDNYKETKMFVIQ